MRIVLFFLLWLWSVGAGATTLRVGLEEADNRPFEYLDDNQQLTGFHVELLRAVATRLGWTLELSRYPWKRAMQQLEHGQIHAASFVAQSPEREAFALFLPHNLLHISRTTIYIQRSRAGEIRYQPPLEQMARRWKMAMPGGYYMNDEIKTLIERGVLIEQPTVTQNRLFSMLLMGRYDAIFGSPRAILSARAEMPDIDQHVQRLDDAVLSGKSMYLAFSRAAPVALAQEFAEAYRLFRLDPAYLALAQRFGVTEFLPKAAEFR